MICEAIQLLIHRMSHTGSQFFHSYSRLGPSHRLVGAESTTGLAKDCELAREFPEMLLILATSSGDATSLW